MFRYCWFYFPYGYERSYFSLENDLFWVEILGVFILVLSLEWLAYVLNEILLIIRERHIKSVTKSQSQAFLSTKSIILPKWYNKSEVAVDGS